MSEQIAACRPDSLHHYASFTLVQFYWALMSSTRLKPAWQHEDAGSSSSEGWEIELQGPAALLAVLASTASVKSRAWHCTLKHGYFQGKEQKVIVKVLCSSCVTAAPGLALSFLWEAQVKRGTDGMFPMAGGNYWADGNLEQCLPSALRPFTFQPRIKAFHKAFERSCFCSVRSVVSL